MTLKNWLYASFSNNQTPLVSDDIEKLSQATFRAVRLCLWSDDIEKLA